jgi:hypothetical protein
VLEPLEANAARTDFKATPEKHDFDSALQTQVGKRLVSVAHRLSIVNTAKKRYQEIRTRIAETTQTLPSIDQTQAALALRAVHADIALLEKQKVSVEELQALRVEKPLLKRQLEDIALSLMAIQPHTEKDPSPTTVGLDTSVIKHLQPERRRMPARNAVRGPRSIVEAYYWQKASASKETTAALDAVQLVLENVLSKATLAKIYEALRLSRES